jgi:hypothetical protein
MLGTPDEYEAIERWEHENGSESVKYSGDTCRCGASVAYAIRDGKVVSITYPQPLDDPYVPSIVRHLRVPVPLDGFAVTNWCPWCDQIEADEEAEEEESP